MIPGGAAASVSIKVDVDDAGAQARIAALEARLKALEKQFGGTGKGAQNYGKQLDDVSKKAGNNNRSHKDLMKSSDALGKMFGRLGKLAKFAGIEFLALSAGLGAMRLALWAGQTTMKGFHALLRATGAAAGVAVGAIATVLAAMRELQAVKLAPVLGGIGNAKTQTNAFFADRRFAMFDQKTMASIMQSAAEQGQVIDAAFRNQLARLADYSLGDPKKLAEIQKVFQQVQKDGKVTAATYAQLQTASPALAKGFDEMAGGTKKGEAAAKAGSVSYKKFFDAVQEGKLKALEPFQGALANINDTLMARFKGSVAGVKEQLTRMGEPLLKGFKRPLTIIEREISLFILKINGTVGKVFPTLFDVKNENSNAITRMFDKLANSVNTNMGKISGWVTSFKTWTQSVKDFFGGTGEVLRKFSTGWDRLSAKVLKPIGSEIVKTIGHLFTEFNKTIGASPLDSFEIAIANIGEIIRNLISGFAQLKQVMAPVLTAFLNIAAAISKITSIPGLQAILPLLLMGRFMGGGRGKVLSTQRGPDGQMMSQTLKGRGGMGGMGGVGGLGMASSMFMSGGMGGGGILGSLMMPLMMGMSGFGMNTKYGASSVGNYKANRDAGSRRLPSLLYSGNLGYGFASNRRGDMGFSTSSRKGGQSLAELSRTMPGRLGVGTSALLSGSSARNAIANGFTDMKGDFIQGAVATTQQERIRALADRRAAMRARTANVMGNETVSSYAQSQGFIKKGKYYYTPSGNRYDKNEMDAMVGRKNATVARTDIANRRWRTTQEIQDDKLQAIATGKIQGKESGKAFVRDSAKKFGKAAGMMAATVGLTMLGGNIAKNAGTNESMAALGGGLSGAGMGASMGAAFGPWGMLAGALGGGVLGALSGASNARKLKRENEKKSINFVEESVLGDKTFNRSEDFKQAKIDLAKTKTNLDMLTPGSATYLQGKIDAFDSEGEKASATLARNVLDQTMTKFPGVDVVGNDAAMAYARDQMFAGKNLSDEQKKSALGGNLTIDSPVEFYAAADYLSTMNDQAGLDDLNRQLDELKTNVPDVAAAQTRYNNLLTEMKAKEEAFNRGVSIVTKTLEGTGVPLSEVSDLFDQLGYSIEETSIGIHEFNTLIGMTGDTATNIANGAGRLGRALLTQTQKDMDLAESRSRLEQQLETMFATKGNVGANEGTKVAGETLNEIVGNAMAELAAGNYDFEEILGKTGESGLLQNQLYELILQGMDGDVSQDVIDQLVRSVFGVEATDGKPAIPGMLADLEKAKTDPFARAQYDGVFNKDFTGKMDELTKILGGKIAGGADPISALNEGMVDLEAFLTDKGIKLDPAAEEKLRNLLGSTLLNTPAAMAEAMRTAGMDVAAMIRAAMTGVTLSLVPNSPLDPTVSVIDNPWTTIDESKTGQGGDDTGGSNPFLVGDTTSSRFSRTMSSHNRFDAMVPGKRMVTSGLRNTNLGSMGSDHATGAAYDIVGDNLVSYANNVKTAGGFSEFHGDTASRHLHVVPPVGDTTSSRSVGYDSGSSTNNYSFQIHGDGADPQEIADAVMDRIARADRNRRERS